MEGGGAGQSKSSGREKHENNLTKLPSSKAPSACSWGRKHLYLLPCLSDITTGVWSSSWPPGSWEASDGWREGGCGTSCIT